MNFEREVKRPAHQDLSWSAITPKIILQHLLCEAKEIHELNVTLEVPNPGILLITSRTSHNNMLPRRRVLHVLHV